MTFRFSPGPWSTGTQGGDGRVVYVGTDMVFLPGSGPTTEANARLIAAAPELFGIICRFVDTLNATSDTEGITRVFSDACNLLDGLMQGE